MTTKELKQELDQLEKELNSKIAELKQITLCICDMELTLQDQVALEEQLQTATDDINELAKKILDTRRWLDFEICGEQIKNGFYNF